MLNPDTEVGLDVVDHLIAELMGDDSIGVIGPRLELEDGTFDHAAKRNSPDALSAFRYLLGKRLNIDLKSSYTAPAVPEYGRGDVDAVNGAFMLMRRSVLLDVGLLDETYWMYGEDLEWCRRFRSRGYRVVYDGRVTAMHAKGGSSGKIRAPRTNWHFHWSMWRYFISDESRLPLPTCRLPLMNSG